MSGKSSIVGSGSLMSEVHYLKKLEQTCMFEDPNQVENYMRASLKDMRPDTPLFESDMARRNNYSEDRLNLRHHGKRVATNPDLPDGTFLDFDGLQRDTRGTAVEPDMKLHRSQQEARGKFIKFFSDADFSVPGEGISEVDMIKLKRSAFYDVKNRKKIFEESMDSFHNGGTNQVLRTPMAECHQVFDSRAPEMKDEMCYNRTNIINDLSNNTSIGGRRTTDHRFKVAKYGLLRKNPTPDTQNYLKNRSNTSVEHDILVSWKDQNVSKSVSVKMIDLAKKKHNDMRNGADLILGKSKKGKTRTKKISTADLITKKSATDESQGPNANMIINGARTQHVTGNMTAQRLDSNRMKKVVIDPFILSYIASVNRRMGTKKISDLREKIAQSAAFNGILIQQSNSAGSTQEIKNEMLWKSIANYEKGVSMKVANYGRIAKNTFIGGAKDDHNTVDFEAYKKSQKTSGQRRGNIQNPDMYIMDATDYDQEVTAPEITGTKLVGALGSKYTRGFIDKGDIEYEMNSEVTARTARG